MKLKGRRLKYTRKTISGTYSQQNLIYIYIRLNYFHFELVDSYKSLSRIKTKRGERRGEKAKKIQRTILLEVERERERKKNSTSSEFVSLPFNDPLISRNRADIA